jgi:hypothetical protein
MSEDLEGRSETLPQDLKIKIDDLNNVYPVPAGIIEWRVYYAMNSAVGEFRGAKIFAILGHKEVLKDEIEVGDVKRGKYPFVDNSMIIGREVAEIWVRYY